MQSKKFLSATIITLSFPVIAVLAIVGGIFSAIYYFLFYICNKFFMFLHKDANHNVY